jgi:hypothetical protein
MLRSLPLLLVQHPLDPVDQLLEASLGVLQLTNECDGIIPPMRAAGVKEVLTIFLLTEAFLRRAQPESTVERAIGARTYDR